MQYFVDEILYSAEKQKKKCLTFYIIIAVVYFLISAGMLVFNILLPYGSELVGLIKGIEYSASGLFVIFSFIYLGIKYKRVKDFYNLSYNLKTGEKESSSGNFLGFDENLSVKDGVDVKSAVFLEWNKYKQDYFERKVYVFYERELPDFKENVSYKYITQGNVLISFETLEVEK